MTITSPLSSHPLLMGTSQKLLFTFLFICLSISLLVAGASASAAHHHHYHSHHRGGSLGPSKLFVFGDSYADTGNNRKTIGNSWKVPYGITFPGKPSGRFSDGRVFTDFLARFMGLKTPLAYRWRKYTPQNLKYGMNFAFGGSGVFDTPAPYPNMTTQIGFLQELVNESIFTPSDLQDSVALVALSGNDYSAYLARGGSVQGFQTFIPQVVNQLALNLESVYSLGVKRIVVTALQPLGCLPVSTVSNSFQECNSTYNKAVSFHNLLLQQAVAKLNNQTTNDRGTPLVVLDLYSSFLSVFQQRGAQQGSLMFDNPLKPCCIGVNQNYSCGSVDAWGNKMYTVCENPKSTFFWDTVHPTQAGWTAVYLALQATLKELHSTWC